MIYRYKDYPDSIIVDSFLYPAAAAIGLKLTDPYQYRSITFVFTPASTNRNFYSPPNDYSVAYGVLNTLELDPQSANSSTTIFYPYPNPAVVNEMSDPMVTFRFQYATDSTGIPTAFNPYMVIDIYNTSGEYVCTVENDNGRFEDKLAGIYYTKWDMKNQNGKDVASGVYLAYARIFEGSVDGDLLQELRTKIAVIR